MKTIPLTRGFVTIVDDDVYEWASKFNWYAWTNTSSGKTYAARHDNVTRTVVLLHRVILSVPKGLVGDHESDDTLDNQRSNLRLATHAQNMRNCRMHPKRAAVSSRFKGVCWDKRRRMWKSTITRNSKTMTVGVFATELEAAHAYDAKAIELSGAFAATNFVGGKLNARLFSSQPRWRKVPVRVSRAVNRTGFRGITIGPGRKWRAVIRINRRLIRSDLCETKVLAAHAYDLLARKYHGAAAILNFPDG